MDIGIAEVRKSEKKHWGGGPRAALRGPNSALGGAEGHPKSIQIDTSGGNCSVLALLAKFYAFIVFLFRYNSIL